MIKNILIASGIFEPEIGGPASYAKALSGKLAENFSVSIITYSSVIKFSDDKKENFRIARIWRGIPKPFRHLLYFLKTFFWAKRANVVFALNAVSAGLPALLAAKIRGKKFIVRIAGDYAWEIVAGKGKTPFLFDDFQKSKRRGKASLLHKIQTFVCRKADAVIVPSSYLNEIVKGWGINESKIKTIYNGAVFKPLVLSREEARTKIGIHGNILLSVGRLVPWKGFRMLIKIMPRLLEINQFFRLVIVGDGPDQKILESMVKNLGLERRVYLVGRKPHEELATYLAASDMFVLNTGYEGFSHQILEAMTAGIPIITTAMGGNKEVIRQGENGFMIKYQDEFNLIEAVKSLWQNPELREEFKKEGKKTVEHFSPEKMLEETVKILTR